MFKVLKVTPVSNFGKQNIHKPNTLTATPGIKQVSGAYYYAGPDHEELQPLDGIEPYPWQTPTTPT